MTQDINNQNTATHDASLLDEERAWLLHEEVRALAREQLLRTKVEDSIHPATVGDTLKRFIEQVTGSAVTDTVRSAISKRL
jgi:hypothetical protein